MTPISTSWSAALKVASGLPLSPLQAPVRKSGGSTVQSSDDTSKYGLNCEQ
jgi:hypothetical protein